MIIITLVFGEMKKKLKGTVNVISRWQGQIYTEPLKGLSDQVGVRYQCFCLLKLFNFNCGFIAKVTCAE